MPAVLSRRNCFDTFSTSSRIVPHTPINTMSNPALTIKLEPVASGVARPSAGTTPLVIEKDGQSAWLHIPQNTSAGPLPLLVVLHGAGKGTYWTLEEGHMSVSDWAGRANKHGCAVLYPAARGSTWDYISSGRKEHKDFEFVTHAINTARRTVPIDDRRIALLGISDGGSMALSLVSHNPKVFQAAMSISAGFCSDPPCAAPGAPKMFIKHGAADSMFPLKRVGLPLRDKLVALGYEVEHRVGKGDGGIFGPAGHVPPGWQEEFLPAWLAMRAE